MKGLTRKLGLITSLASLPVLAPFCGEDASYDRGGALDSGGMLRLETGTPGPVDCRTTE